MTYDRSRFFTGLLILAAAAVLMGAGPNGPDVRWVEGFATRDHLWLRNAAGALVQIDRASHARRVLASDRVIDAARSEGHLLILRRAERANAYDLVDLSAGARAFPRLQTADPPIALLAASERDDKGPVVLAHGALFRLVEGSWRKTALSAPLRWAAQIAVASDAAGTIYVGLNSGKFGGGLQAVDPSTGAVTEVQRTDAGVCAGPLGPECDPVTGVIRDKSRPNCVLASVGLSHYEAHGRILEVCDGSVEVVFSEAIPGRESPETWPFFGLAAKPDGWAAASESRLFVSKDGAVTSSAMPMPERWGGGLQVLALGDDLVAVVTDVNAGVSLSGDTPLLVSVGE
jgi:hypothetical protein